MAVPILNSSPMGNISLDKLPSEADFLNLLWFHTGGNFSGFRGEYQNTKFLFHFYFSAIGIPSICCPVVNQFATCATKCHLTENPCMLAKLKSPWERGGFPLKCDRQILELLKSLKKRFWSILTIFDQVV